MNSLVKRSRSKKVKRSRSKKVKRSRSKKVKISRSKKVKRSRSKKVKRSVSKKVKSYKKKSSESSESISILKNLIKNDGDISDDGAQFIYDIIQQKPTLQNYKEIARKIYNDKGYSFYSEYDYALIIVKKYLTIINRS